MIFWIFTLIMNLLIPIIMIVYGIIFEKKTPPIAKSRFAFGYRTSMSMKSKDTWDYAHKFFGKLWFRYGIIICALSIIALLFVFVNSFSKKDYIYFLLYIGGLGFISKIEVRKYQNKYSKQKTTLYYFLIK